MSANPRELIEAVHGVRAIEDMLGGPLSGQSATWAMAQALTGGGAVGSSVEEKEEQTGPRLTGDPEWDAMELADWDPSNEPLKVVR